MVGVEESDRLRAERRQFGVRPVHAGVHDRDADTRAGVRRLDRVDVHVGVTEGVELVDLAVENDRVHSRIFGQSRERMDGHGGMHRRDVRVPIEHADPAGRPVSLDAVGSVGDPLQSDRGGLGGDRERMHRFRLPELQQHVQVGGRRHGERHEVRRDLFGPRSRIVDELHQWPGRCLPGRRRARRGGDREGHRSDQGRPPASTIGRVCVRHGPAYRREISRPQSNTAGS